MGRFHLKFNTLTIDRPCGVLKPFLERAVVEDKNFSSNRALIKEFSSLTVEAFPLKSLI